MTVNEHELHKQNLFFRREVLASKSFFKNLAPQPSELGFQPPLLPEPNDDFITLRLLSFFRSQI